MNFLSFLKNNFYHMKCWYMKHILALPTCQEIWSCEELELIDFGNFDLGHPVFWQKFREINFFPRRKEFYCKLISRKKNLQNHSVEKWKNEKFTPLSLSEKYFVKSTFRNFFSKNVTFTKFLHELCTVQFFVKTGSV